MLIKLECRICGGFLEIDDKELNENHKICPLCNGKMEVKNLDELVKFDVETQIKNNIDKWQKQFGWDYVIDLVKKYKDYYAVGRLYVEELEKRGFKIK
jgi:hypothetical protein